MLRQYFRSVGYGLLYFLMILVIAPLFGIVTISLANAVGGETTPLGMAFVLGIPVLAAWYLAYRNRLEKEAIAYRYFHTRRENTWVWILKMPEWRIELFACLTLILPVAINIAFIGHDSPLGEKIFSIFFILILAGILFAVMNTLCWALVCWKWKRMEHKVKQKNKAAAE